MPFCPFFSTCCFLLAFNYSLVGHSEGPIVAETRRQGGIIVAKSVTTEFAMSGTGENALHGTPANVFSGLAINGIDTDGTSSRADRGTGSGSGGHGIAGVDGTTVAADGTSNTTTAVRINPSSSAAAAPPVDGGVGGSNGRAGTPRFHFGADGRNRRLPGGSSAGSAVSVALGQVSLLISIYRCIRIFISIYVY